MTSESLLVSTRKGLIQLKRNGDWMVERSSHHGVHVVNAMRDARDRRIWASLDHGHWGCKLSVSSDDGQTWDEVEAPKYPKGALRGDGEPAATTLIWTLVAGPADKPGRLYAGTEPGGLFISDDGGASWSLNRGLWDHPSRQKQWFGGGRDQPAIHSVVVDPRDSNHVYIAISCAGVFESKDDGATWHPRNRGLTADFLPNPDAEVGQDPHLLTICAGSPATMWQQNHCGVYRSTDAGTTWVDVSTQDKRVYFGFAIVADPANPNTAWVVPGVSDENRIAIDGSLFVAQTRDGGATWQEHTTGLPQRDCWDIVYRHALALSGDTLVFGTTTGNLYTSDDRGENWRCIANNLPPIHAIEFT